MSDSSAKGKNQKKDNSSKAPAQNSPAPPSESESGDLYETRLEKLEKLRADGYDPYQKHFRPEAKASDVHALPEKDLESQPVFKLGGRIRSKRMMGKAGFMDLVDDSGRIQIYGRKDEEGINFDVFKSLDLGDIVGVVGYPFVTKMGERTLHVTELELVSKCLRPLPVVKEADGKV
ncbi:MAG: hypothetical protein KDK33_13280, partial [Leptospiraceae bacterium]|nr:hypothetical protein [Leptospiraceae bacterium]